MNRKVHVSKR